MLAIFLIIVSAIASAPQKRWPRFEDYPARNDYVRQPAPAKIKGRHARLFRTAIREGAKDGPNFAGHYTIVRWRVGSDFHQFAIVDARTGDVYLPNELTQIDSCCWPGLDPLGDEEFMQFNKRSRLLIAVGRRYIGEHDRGMGKFFYIWRNNRLKLIASIRRDF